MSASTLLISVWSVSGILTYVQWHLRRGTEIHCIE